MKQIRQWFLIVGFMPFVACPTDRAHALIDNICVKIWHNKEEGKLSITIGHGVFRSTHSLPISDTGFDDTRNETTKEKVAYSDSFADFSVSLVSKTRLCCDILCGGS